MIEFKNTIIVFLLFFCGITGSAQTSINHDQLQINSLLLEANKNFEIGDFQTAIKLGNEALEKQLALTGEDDLNTANVLTLLAGYYFQNDNMKDALALYKRLQIIQEKYLSPDTEMAYSHTLGNIAKCKNSLGFNEEALDDVEKVIEFRRSRFGEESLTYGTALADKATFLFAAGDFDQAIKYCKEGLKIIDNSVGKEHRFYIIHLNNLLMYNLADEKYPEAVEESEDLLPLLVTMYGKKHPYFLRALNTKVIAWTLSGNKEESTRACEELIHLLEENYSKIRSDYVHALQSLSSFYLPTFDAEKITATATECSKLATELVRDSFTTLTAEERAYFWKEYQPWFQEMLPLIVELYPTDGLLRQLYDDTLFSKGLLLNSDTELKNLIMEEADQSTIDLFNEFSETKVILSELYEIPKDQRPISVEELREIAYDLENKLLERSKAFGDFTRNFSIKWEDVRDNLSKNDLAIEFINYPDDQSERQYCALLLRKEYSTPRIVHLFSEPQLAEIENDKIYTTTQMSELIWKNILDELDKSDNIYFSPSGQLYNLAIESLPIDMDALTYMSDKYKLTRLSSTRQLALAKGKTKFDTADVYGGLIYDTDVTQLEADNRKYRNRATRGEPFDFDPEELGLRGKVNYLPGTKTEADNITSTLLSGRVSTNLFIGDEGTEASFKDLSGKSVNLLHLATHGFFWNERSAKRHSYLNFISDNRPQSEEDKMLSRSGLLLSGANNALSRKAIPDNVEDGILTAAEISRLDFKNLDLVVLSACQTGLGEIKGEGVFGLQRGFKKAGANTIMMSLWSVPDIPTQLLMSRFYDNLFVRRNPYTDTNYTKREALQEAQKYVRNYNVTDENGKVTTPYSSPENWAAFIILDTI